MAINGQFSAQPMFYAVVHIVQKRVVYSVVIVPTVS